MSEWCHDMSILLLVGMSQSVSIKIETEQIVAFRQEFFQISQLRSHAYFAKQN